MKDACDAMKKSSVTSSFEQSDDIEKSIEEFLKHEGYREFKFVRGEAATAKFLQVITLMSARNSLQLLTKRTKMITALLLNLSAFMVPFVQKPLAIVVSTNNQ